MKHGLLQANPVSILQPPGLESSAWLELLQRCGWARAEQVPEKALRHMFQDAWVKVDLSEDGGCCLICLEQQLEEGFWNELCFV